MPEVRLIDDEGQQVGVLKTADALQLRAGARPRPRRGRARGPAARVPRARLLEVQVRAGPEAQAGAQAPAADHVREIKFRPKIAQHDYDTKKHHVERFLRHKDKVKVTIMFRGREVTHPERGMAILDRLAEELSELGVVEQRPMQEGRNMTMMMAPVESGARRAPRRGEVHGEVSRRTRAVTAALGRDESPLSGAEERARRRLRSAAPSDGAPAAEAARGRRRDDAATAQRRSPPRRRPRCGGRGHRRVIISGSPCPR